MRKFKRRCLYTCVLQEIKRALPHPRAGSQKECGYNWRTTRFPDRDWIGAHPSPPSPRPGPLSWGTTPFVPSKGQEQIERSDPPETGAAFPEGWRGPTAGICCRVQALLEFGKALRCARPPEARRTVAAACTPAPPPPPEAGPGHRSRAPLLGPGAHSWGHSATQRSAGKLRPTATPQPVGQRPGQGHLSHLSPGKG